jgi:hypothetical protein
MGKKSGSGSAIRLRDEQTGSNFQTGIRDGKNSDPGWRKFGSGINIPDPQHWTEEFEENG